MAKVKKIGKDVFDKKSTGIIRTAREREEYEEYKRRKAEEEEEEQEKRKKLKPIGSEKMPDEREPKPEGLSLEEWAQLKALAKLKKKTQTE